MKRIAYNSETLHGSLELSSISDTRVQIVKEISPDLFDKEKSRTNCAVPLRGSASHSEKVLKKVAKKFGGKKKRLYFCTPKHGKSKVKIK